MVPAKPPLHAHFCLCSRPCKFSATRMNAGFLALCGPPNLPGFVEQAADSFRSRLAEMIDLRHPLAVLASRLPWTQIEAALAPYFARRVRAGRVLEHDDLFGPSLQVAGAGVAAAGRPRLPLRLMASLLYLKHVYKL